MKAINSTHPLYTDEEMEKDHVSKYFYREINDNGHLMALASEIAKQEFDYIFNNGQIEIQFLTEDGRPSLTKKSTDLCVCFSLDDDSGFRAHTTLKNCLTEFCNDNLEMCMGNDEYSENAESVLSCLAGINAHIDLLIQRINAALESRSRKQA